MQRCAGVTACREASLNGTVRLIFQPAEEVGRGHVRVILTLPPARGVLVG